MKLDLDTSWKKKYGRILVWILLVVLGLLFLTQSSNASNASSGLNASNASSGLNATFQAGGGSSHFEKIKDLLDSFEL
jgi:hypothetical protein